ncbi:interleukin-1 beta-like [Carassius carassius]|uniref:interleukin-1 beta-like n=1 Tax=Carassius carassius TaxID=217509 RepID=UPI0028686E19|nr:interleukin-1 beta-like [Carassius carassius]
MRVQQEDPELFRSLLDREGWMGTASPSAPPAHMPLTKMGPANDPEAFLDLFERTAEAYEPSSRGSASAQNNMLRDSCRKWLLAGDGDAESIINAVVLEQFVSRLPKRTAQWSGVSYCMHPKRFTSPHNTNSKTAWRTETQQEDIVERLVKPLNVTPTYSKASRTLQCTICDKYKKTLVQSNKLTNEDLHLKAVTLSAGNIQYKVRFSMSTYLSSAPLNKGQPVCLAISNSNLYIACTESDGSSPILILKEVSGPLNTIKVGDPNGYDSLLFFRKETGTAYNTFESVKYPGWYISTAFDDWERVEMIQVPTDRTTNFTLEDQQAILS